MHCPTCGQQQVSDQTRFCSRCGFPLTGIAEIIAHGGLVPSKPPGLTGNADSPRRRGIKQGVFLFLLTFLVVPLMGLLTLALDIEPFLPAIAVFLLGVGGLLRVVYALMFESGTAPGLAPALIQALPPNAENRGSLPAGYSIPASAYTSPAAGSWRDTNELQHGSPGSVTDSTTKLLQKEDEGQ